MPIDTRDWYTEKRDDYKPPRNRWKLPRPLKSKLRPSKIFLIFLITACVVVTVYTGYLLFTHQTNWVVGAIVLAADIGVLIWNISALRKWSVGAGTVISIFLVIAFLGATACAFSGVEPFSDAKDKVVGYIPASVKDKVMGYFPASINEAGRTVWVEDITVGPQLPVVFLPDLSLRLVTVNLRASDAAFEGYSKLGCKVELRSGSYYYGYYRVSLRFEDVSHLKRSGVNLLFPIPADEPVFQSGGKFSTKVSSNPKWADLPCGLYDNPYKDFVE